MEHNDRLAREKAAKDEGGNIVVHDWEIRQRGWTPAQIETVKRLRRLKQKYATR